EQVAAAYGVPIELDGGADGLWTMCFRRLELFSAYEHRGFNPLIAQANSSLGISLAKDRKRAERARAQHQRTFGDRGLAFLRGPFRDQCEVTGSILRLVKEDGLSEELGKFVGESLVEQLFELQAKYETMVVDQLQSVPAGGKDLRELRRRIARLIGQYNNSVLDMLDEDEPKTLQVVVNALRPMVTLRELIAASRGKAAGDQDGGDLEAALGGEDVGEVGEPG